MTSCIFKLYCDSNPRGPCVTLNKKNKTKKNALDVMKGGNNFGHRSSKRSTC